MMRRSPTLQTATPPGNPGEPYSDESRVSPDRLAVRTAVELLAHWWSRPTSDEMDVWRAAVGVESDTARALSGDDVSWLSCFSLVRSTDELLEEYERLFVGPGPVTCPPYESYWREDVPIDIRRSLMGPCTADLMEIYAALGLRAGSFELPDHVAVVFEALAFGLSWEPADDVSRRIVSEHLRGFLPRLCRAVDHEAEQPFYRRLAQVTLDWVIPVEQLLGVVQGSSQAH